MLELRFPFKNHGSKFEAETAFLCNKQIILPLIKYNLCGQTEYSKVKRTDNGLIHRYHKEKSPRRPSGGSFNILLCHNTMMN